jgi:hypothetical protein
MDKGFITFACQANQRANAIGIAIRDRKITERGDYAPNCYIVPPWHDGT